MQRHSSCLIVVRPRHFFKDERSQCSTVLINIFLSPLCNGRFWADARCSVCKQSICRASHSFEPDAWSLSLIREETAAFSLSCASYCLWAGSWWCSAVKCSAPGCSKTTWTETGKPRTPLKQLFAASQAMGNVQQRELLTNWHNVSFSSSFSAVKSSFFFSFLPHWFVFFFLTWEWGELETFW